MHRVTLFVDPMKLLALFTRVVGTALVAAAVTCSPAFAQAPQPPEVAAKSFLVVDLTSNQTLAEREADTPADPASLTKLMSLYVVFTAIHDKKIALDQRLPVSKRAWDCLLYTSDAADE